ncbi:MAG: 3-isopropylmalate dehydratase small subunit [Candidatus Marinimicrobia bacterium]|nr:3-isopropylmalate dehydratase small subunit [Candidatus Neomarinimicrobiota bacterium]
MQGKAHLYPRDHINTDEIIPARYLIVHAEAELARHAMEDIDADFVNQVAKGDFIVAGGDFGCGSSREHAVWALRGAGIRAVLADSFARIFFRNAVNNGFYAIEIDGISDKVTNGDQLQLDPEKGVVQNITKGEEYRFSPFTDYFRDVITAGGLMKYLAAR